MPHRRSGTAIPSDGIAIQPALTLEIRRSGSTAHIATRPLCLPRRAVSMLGNTRPRPPSHPASACVTRVPAR
ncbi:hypothetical protein GGR64_000578 [Xanthomonas arboricola]|nr:hypothetical protein [Xanthomonas sp. 3307]